MNIVSGSATPTTPNTTPPSVGAHDARELHQVEQPRRPLDEHHQQRHHEGREQAQRDPRQQLPVLERVLRHLVGVEEHGAGDGEVDPERDARGHDLADEGLGEPMATGASELQDEHHHDDRAGEQPAVRAAEAGQGAQLRVFPAELASLGDPAAGSAAHGAQGLLRAQAGAADQRHRRDDRDPRHQPRVDVPLLQIGDQAGDLLGQARQAAQQPHDDTGPRGDRHPPPLPAEPARIGIDIPAAPEPDHSHEHQTGERAEHPQGHRVPHEHPELPILGERR